MKVYNICYLPLMAKWLEQAFQFYEMYCHELEFMGSIINKATSGIKCGIKYGFFFIASP